MFYALPAVAVLLLLLSWETVTFIHHTRTCAACQRVRALRRKKKSHG